MVIIKTKQAITNVDKDMEQWKPSYCWWKCKMEWPLWKTVWQFLRKLPCDPAIPFLRMYPKELKVATHTDIYVPMSIQLYS